MVIVQKQEKKYQSRWSLFEWFKIRREIAWQNMWLSYNTNSDYTEFFFGGEGASDYNFESNESGTEIETGHTLRKYYVGFYMSLLGLEASYETDSDLTEAITGIINFRLAGDYDQGTNLKIFLGGSKIETVNNENVVLNFYGLGQTIYFTKFLGFTGIYRSYIPNLSSQQNKVDGYYGELGGFLEGGPFRIYGKWFKERQNYIGVNTNFKYIKEGVRVGLMIYL